MAYEYPANKKSLKSKGDYGIRVARYGYDAGNCPDGQLLFNSNWPIIQIVMMKKIDGEPKLIGSTEYPEVTASTPWELVSEYDKDVAGVDRKSIYTKAHIRRYGYTEIVSGMVTEHLFFQIDMYGFSHNLGYAPMFFSETDFNGGDQSQNRVVLTNINIEEDIDYPYLDTPTMLMSYSGDYGIKSKAYFASRLEPHNKKKVGLDTSIQGKQIQAIKTQKTLAEDGWGQDQSPSCVYFPPEDANGKPFMSADQFEYYGYVSNILACLRSPDTFNAEGMGSGNTHTNVFSPLKFDHGDIYFRTMVFAIPMETFSTSDTITGAFITPASVSGTYGYGEWEKQSLVVVRMPMVAPDIVDVEVS